MTKSIFKFTLVLFVLGAMQFIDFSHYSIPLAYAAVDCNAAGIICKSGVLTGNETWTAGNVYMVTGDVTVPNGATLTIQAGTIVKFQTDDSLFVSGKLVASGTLAELIYFTSYRDDSVGGDTNNDGFSAAAVEDWGRIVFNDNSDDTSIIQHVTIRYSGNDGYSSNDYGPIQLINASPTLKNITFESNYINGVEIPGGNWQTDSWDNTDVVYYVRKDLTIPAGNTLTISPGVVVKFTPDTSLLVDGKLVASGTNSNNIIFTSYRDDSAGGDTNTGGFSAGLVEDWGRIRFNDQSDDTSIIQYMTIRYSGNDGYSSNDYGAIELANASPSLNNITFTSNYINGVEVSATPLATDSWDNPDVVYYVRKDLTISAGNILTISPGVIVKLASDTSLFVEGGLRATGTLSNNVILTSYRDDSVGGDTNNNGFSAGAVEDWGRIQFKDGSDDTSIIQHTTIRYSGNDGYSSNDFGAIQLLHASPSISHTTLTNNYSGVEALNGSIPKMTCNRIYDNTHLGIDNDTSANIIKAENHWWGDASGPTHTGNPGGTGQAVSDGVDYSPWAADTGCSTPATQLQATPAGLSFQTTPGQNPATQSISLSSSDGSSLTWSATETLDWLSVSPGSGNSPATVEVSIDVAGLGDGSYDGSLTLTSPQTQNSPVNIPVSLTIGAETGYPNDPRYGEQWGLGKIRAPAAWDQTQGSANVTIAVIDTGVEYTHSDLSGKVLTANDWDYINNDNDALDDHGHGTHVAGIAAANTHNGVGVAGVCPNCRILPFKTLDRSGAGAGWDDLAQAIRDSADRGASVINMSLGGGTCTADLADAVNYAYTKGVVMVAASGNACPVKVALGLETYEVMYPAKFNRIIAVGATTPADQRADFSHYGPELDLTAPGTGIVSTYLDNGYASLDGTSMAAPHVAGAVGMLRSQNPGLTPAQVKEVLQNSADDLNAPGRDDETGWGRLNLNAALQATVGAGETEPPAVCEAVVQRPPQSPEENLVAFYQSFRDEVLLESEVGKVFVADFYRYGPEMAQILVANPALLSQTAEFLANASEEFGSLMPGAARTDIKLTQEQYVEADDLIRDLAAAAAGSDLQDRLLQVWDELDMADDVGKTPQKIWDDLHPKVYLPLVIR